MAWYRRMAWSVLLPHNLSTGNGQVRGVADIHYTPTQQPIIIFSGIPCGKPQPTNLLEFRELGVAGLGELEVGSNVAERTAPALLVLGATLLCLFLEARDEHAHQYLGSRFVGGIS